jgi:CRISPR-associated protein Csb2
MLAIGIRYLCGMVWATHPTDREQAEWPPHPDRVFMALAAAYFDTDGSTTEGAVLEWLERQEPPNVYASDCEFRQTVTAYVPVNDIEIARVGSLGKRIARYESLKTLDQAKDAGLALLPESRPRQSRSFPAAIPDDPVVYLCWPNTVPPASVRSVLAELCSKVSYVGHSSSLVQMWVEDNPTQPNWVPDDTRPRYRMRVFSPGRLQYFRDQFGEEALLQYRCLTEQIESLSAEMKAVRGKGSKVKKDLLKRRIQEIEHQLPSMPPRDPLRPTPGKWQGYVRVASDRFPSTTPQSVFDHTLIVLRRVGGRQFGLESTLQVTKALRDVLMIKCPTQPPPEWISGHKPDGKSSEGPHLALIPLANVGFEHSDGHLLGVAVVLPRSAPSQEMKLLHPLIGYDDQGELVSTTLTLGAVGECILQLEDRDSRPVAMQESLWTGPARRWATVTPVVFDSHPKQRWNRQDPPRVRAERQAAYWREVEDIIRTAAERIGLPRPVEVLAQPTSLFVGAPHARQMPLLQRKGGGNLHHTHAVVVFDQPVTGPVLLGAGRYRGYGLCRPLREDEEL